MTGSNIDFSSISLVKAEATVATVDSDVQSGDNLLKSEDSSTDSTNTEGSDGTDSTDGTEGTDGTDNTDATNTENSDEANTTNNTDGETNTEGTTDASVPEGEIIDASGDSGDMVGMDGMGEVPMDMGAETTVKDSFLSKPLPVFGISAATLVVGAIIGILLAKKKIKKGIDLYED